MQPERISLSLVKVGILAVALSLGGTLAFAASGGGSSGSGARTPSCPKGEVWNGSKCAKSTSSLDDKQLYTQGRDLALAGRYTEALTALEAVKNQNDAMVLTMIGYSKRKLGNYADGVALYQRAL